MYAALRAMPPEKGNPFAKLEQLRDRLPSVPVQQSAAPAAAPAPKVPARAVVRMERKQRGGKEVTVVEKLGLTPDELARWCRELKQALGCGGTTEGDTIVLQGDLRTRLPALLEGRGVGRVTVG
jgi:translation initiation factor 1